MLYTVTVELSFFLKKKGNFFILHATFSLDFIILTFAVAREQEFNVQDRVDIVHLIVALDIFIENRLFHVFDSM